MTEIMIRTSIAYSETKDVPLDIKGMTTDITALYLNVTQEIPSGVTERGRFDEGLIFFVKSGGEDEVGTQPYDAGMVTRMPNRTLILEEPIQLGGEGKWFVRFINQSTFTLTLDLVVYCTKGKAETIAPMFPLSKLNLEAQKTSLPKTKPPAAPKKQ